MPSATMPATTTPRIAIIGGGPAGLTLARILHVNGIPSTIFELDKHALSRPQGGTLDLHETTGQEALRRAGLFEAFQKNAHYDAEDLIVSDRSGKRHVEVLGQDTGRPEIDRTDLRQILLDSIPKGQIKWGKKLAKAEVGTLHFTDGSVESGYDLIVGGDGAWSKVRPLLTTVPPFYSGISGVDMNILNIDKTHPELSQFHGKGSHFIYGEEVGKVLLCQRCGDGSIRAYAFGRLPETWYKNNGVDWSDLTKAKEAICEWFSDFSPSLLEYVRCADTVTSRPLYQLPVGLKWQHQPGVAVIGDAAHLMTPFAGVGVNAALTDAMILADEIVKNSSNLDLAVRKYEEEMFEYAESLTQRTWTAMMERFREGGIAKFKARVEDNLAKRADGLAQKSEPKKDTGVFSD